MNDVEDVVVVADVVEMVDADVEADLVVKVDASVEVRVKKVEMIQRVEHFPSSLHTKLSSRVHVYISNICSDSWLSSF